MEGDRAQRITATDGGEEASLSANGPDVGVPHTQTPHFESTLKGHSGTSELVASSTSFLFEERPSATAAAVDTRRPLESFTAVPTFGATPQAHLLSQSCAASSVGLSAGIPHVATTSALPGMGAGASGCGFSRHAEPMETISLLLQQPPVRAFGVEDGPPWTATLASSPLAVSSSGLFSSMPPPPLLSVALCDLDEVRQSMVAHLSKWPKTGLLYRLRQILTVLIKEEITMEERQRQADRPAGRDDEEGLSCAPSSGHGTFHLPSKHQGSSSAAVAALSSGFLTGTDTAPIGIPLRLLQRARAQLVWEYEAMVQEELNAYQRDQYYAWRRGQDRNVTRGGRTKGMTVSVSQAPVESMQGSPQAALHTAQGDRMSTFMRRALDRRLAAAGSAVTSVAYADRAIGDAIGSGRNSINSCHSSQQMGGSYAKEKPPPAMKLPVAAHDAVPGVVVVTPPFAGGSDHTGAPSDTPLDKVECLSQKVVSMQDATMVGAVHAVQLPLPAHLSLVGMMPAAETNARIRMAAKNSPCYTHAWDIDLYDSLPTVLQQRRTKPLFEEFQSDERSAGCEVPPLPSSPSLTNSMRRLDEMEIPMPTFIYVVSRLLFRLHYARCFPSGLFTPALTDPYHFPVRAQAHPRFYYRRFPHLLREAEMKRFGRLQRLSYLRDEVPISPEDELSVFFLLQPPLRHALHGLVPEEPVPWLNLTPEDEDSYLTSSWTASERRQRRRYREHLQSVGCHPQVLSEVASMMACCRLIAYEWFASVDSEQRGAVRWSDFTDSLIETAEVQHHRGRAIEAVHMVGSSASVFDRYIVEPFPARLVRLGYVGPVTEVRHSGSLMLLEGPFDYAVCDGAALGSVRMRLLVRSLKTIYDDVEAAMLSARASAITQSHSTASCRGGMAAAGSGAEFVNRNDGALAMRPWRHNQLTTGVFIRYDDGKRLDEDAALQVIEQLKTSHQSDDDDDDKDDPKNMEGVADPTMRCKADRRGRIQLESALAVTQVLPDSPMVIITMHSDLMLRLYNLCHYSQGVPETALMRWRETMTSMDWAGAAAESDKRLRKVLVFGTRSGDVVLIDLRLLFEAVPALGGGRDGAESSGPVGDMHSAAAGYLRLAARTYRGDIARYVSARQKFHEGVVSSVCVGAGGILVTGGMDGNVTMARIQWAIGGGADKPPKSASLVSLRSFPVCPSGVRRAVSSDASQLIAAQTASNRILLYGIANPSLCIELYDPVAPHYYPLASILIVDGLNQIISADTSGFVKAWCLSRCHPITSFYALTEEAFSTFSTLLDEDVVYRSKGERSRLNDVDNPNASNRYGGVVSVARDATHGAGSSSGGGSGGPGESWLLESNRQTIEASLGPSRLLCPLRDMAFDHVMNRLVVTGFHNAVMSTFLSGKGGVAAHSERVLYLTVCTRSGWLLSSSSCDCRIWQVTTGTLSLGIRANHPEYNLLESERVRCSDRSVQREGRCGGRDAMGGSVSAAMGCLAQGSHSASGALDANKHLPCTVDDVMRGVIRRRGPVSSLGRSGSRRMRTVQAGAAEAAHTERGADMSHFDTGINASMSSALVKRENPGTEGAGGLADNDGMRGDNTRNANARHCDMMCVCISRDERHLFYALSTGDIRVHRSDSGRLLKTFMTIPPTTSDILEAVLHYRHLILPSKSSSARDDTLISTDISMSRAALMTGVLGAGRMTAAGGTSQRLSLAQRLEAVAIVLQRLLKEPTRVRSGVILPSGERQVRFHLEPVGLVCLEGTQELLVVYADGLLRFFSLVGNSSTAHRIFIPEYLVTRALYYLNTPPPKRRVAFYLTDGPVDEDGHEGLPDAQQAAARTTGSTGQPLLPLSSGSLGGAGAAAKRPARGHSPEAKGLPPVIAKAAGAFPSSSGGLGGSASLRRPSHISKNASTRKDSPEGVLPATQSSSRDASAPFAQAAVEADAVSLVATSTHLQLVCIVQVSGTVSIVDVSGRCGDARDAAAGEGSQDRPVAGNPSAEAATGVKIIHSFTTAEEITAATFLSAYPCLVLADRRGGVHFYLVSGAPLLALFDDFYKAVLLERHATQHRVQQHSVKRRATGAASPQAAVSPPATGASEGPLVWSISIPSGIPSTLYYDHRYGALYVGTKEGFVHSFLIRRLLLALNLQPLTVAAAGVCIDAYMLALKQQQLQNNEAVVRNVLLVLFGITPAAIAAHLQKTARRRREGAPRTPGSRQGPSCMRQRGKRPRVATATGDALHPHDAVSTATTSSGARQQSVNSEDSPMEESLCAPTSASYHRDSSRQTADDETAPLEWRNSLLWVYENCKPLFHPPASTSHSTADRRRQSSCTSEISLCEDGPMGLHLGSAVERRCSTTFSSVSSFGLPVASGYHGGGSFHIPPISLQHATLSDLLLAGAILHDATHLLQLRCQISDNRAAPAAGTLASSTGATFAPSALHAAGAMMPSSNANTEFQFQVRSGVAVLLHKEYILQIRVWVHDALRPQTTLSSSTKDAPRESEAWVATRSAEPGNRGGSGLPPKTKVPPTSVKSLEGHVAASGGQDLTAEKLLQAVHGELFAGTATVPQRRVKQLKRFWTGENWPGVTAATEEPLQSHDDNPGECGACADTSESANTSSRLSNGLMSRWIEPLFVRHVLFMSSNTPLALLSPPAMLERARREHLQREPLSDTHSEPEESAGCDGSRRQRGAWDEFVEGTLPRGVMDVFNRPGCVLKEAARLSRLDGGVTYLTGRRNGYLFIGTADGTVSLWTPYACARIEQICTSTMLPRTIRDMGESIKQQFRRRHEDACLQRQRTAFADDGALGRNSVEAEQRIKARVKERLMQHFVEQMKKEEAEQNKKDDEDGDDGTAEVPARGTATHALPSFDSPKRRMQKMAYLVQSTAGYTNTAGLQRKSLLAEDLYFLPLSMRQLADLETFDPAAYDAAVDVAVARVLDEVCEEAAESEEAPSLIGRRPRRRSENRRASYVEPVACSEPSEMPLSVTGLRRGLERAVTDVDFINMAHMTLVEEAVEEEAADLAVIVDAASQIPGRRDGATHTSAVKWTPSGDGPGGQATSLHRRSAEEKGGRECPFAGSCKSLAQSEPGRLTTNPRGAMPSAADPASADVARVLALQHPAKAVAGRDSALFWLTSAQEYPLYEAGHSNTGSPVLFTNVAGGGHRLEQQQYNLRRSLALAVLRDGDTKESETDNHAHTDRPGHSLSEPESGRVPPSHIGSMRSLHTVGGRRDSFAGCEGAINALALERSLSHLRGAVTTNKKMEGDFGSQAAMEEAALKHKERVETFKMVSHRRRTLVPSLEVNHVQFLSLPTEENVATGACSGVDGHESALDHAEAETDAAVPVDVQGDPVRAEAWLLSTTYVLAEPLLLPSSAVESFNNSRSDVGTVAMIETDDEDLSLLMGAADHHHLPTYPIEAAMATPVVDDGSVPPGKDADRAKVPKTVEKALPGGTDLSRGVSAAPTFFMTSAETAEVCMPTTPSAGRTCSASHAPYSASSPCHSHATPSICVSSAGDQGTAVSREHVAPPAADRAYGPPTQAIPSETRPTSGTAWPPPATVMRWSLSSKQCTAKLSRTATSGRSSAYPRSSTTTSVMARANSPAELRETPSPKRHSLQSSRPSTGATSTEGTAGNAGRRHYSMPRTSSTGAGGVAAVLHGGAGSRPSTRQGDRAAPGRS